MPPREWSNDSDTELIEMILQGNTDAFEELYRRYRLLCYRVAYRFLHDESAALDCVQEVFLKVFQRLDQFQHQSSFKTWLMRVMSNSALDAGRKRQRTNNHQLNGWPDDLDVPAIQPEIDEQMLHHDLQRTLQSALQQLPTAQREAFIWHVEGELTYREIADLQNVSIGTVMSRLFYARRQLKQLLADQLWN